MKRIAIMTAAALAFGAHTTAHGYSAQAEVTFSWATDGTHIGWTSNGENEFPDPAVNGNDTQATTAGGNNSTALYNSDFASSSDYEATPDDDCLTPIDIDPVGPGPEDYEEITLRKYSCRHNDTVEAYPGAGYAAPIYHASPPDDPTAGAKATGTLTVTDTALTGTLTVITTTDEPSGATTTFLGGVRTSNSAGDGADGYNVRTADGSPFGNAWYGVTTSATLQVNLTGTFNATEWTIDGGVVNFSDPGFACQQGGFGGSGAGTLCSRASTVTGGSFEPDGGHLNWGMDVDGSATGTTEATPIEIRDSGGAAPIATLSGVRADLTLDVSGNISTTQGEFRSASGSAGGGCLNHIRWGARPPPETTDGITCGTLTAGLLAITGVATEGNGGPDTDPEQFTFNDPTDVEVSTEQISDPITVTGIDAAAPISVTGGEYSINAAEYTSAAGTVEADDTVTVRHTSSASTGTAVDTVLTIGTVSDTFTSTTAGEPPPDGGEGLREDDGGSSLDALILALLGLSVFLRRRSR